jgi:hypothetical protein
MECTKPAREKKFIISFFTKSEEKIAACGVSMATSTGKLADELLLLVFQNLVWEAPPERLRQGTHPSPPQF